MLITVRYPQRPVSAILWAAVAGLLALPSAPCRANVAPESGLLAHVQPVTGSCETPITECAQIIRSTSADGPVEFLIFFMKGFWSWPGEEICLRSVHNELSWPEAWQLVAFDPCGGGTGSLVPNGATHALDLAWTADAHYGIGDLPGGVIPVARLVMNVVGPGRLDMGAQYGQDPIVLQHDCSGSTFVTYPVQIYAEAGIPCGHISAHCGYSEEACAAHFDIPALVLSATLGGIADSTVKFWAQHQFMVDELCPLAVDTHAPWCTAWIDSVYEYMDAQLHVTADAAGLAPGAYETEIELYSANWEVARCLPLTLNVEETVAVGSPGPADPALGSFSLRLLGPNPSSGPFTLAHDAPAGATLRGGVFDASGREIASLTDREQFGGRHTMTWTATDAGGRPVRSGVYVIRVAADGQTRSSRVIVVR